MTARRPPKRPGSQRWIRRHVNDPYVKRARAEGYRSRAAFKLIELDERFGILKNTRSVLDLGCAPGGWSQVALARTKPGTRIVGVDLQEVDPLSGVIMLQGDAFALSADALGDRFDVVLSDMAPATMGHAATDALRMYAILRELISCVNELLNTGGSLIMKSFQGGREQELLALLRARFSSARCAKPPSSYADSRELYFVAMGFKGYEA